MTTLKIHKLYQFETATNFVYENKWKNLNNEEFQINIKYNPYPIINAAQIPCSVIMNCISLSYLKDTLEQNKRMIGDSSNGAQERQSGLY